MVLRHNCSEEDFKEQKSAIKSLLKFPSTSSIAKGIFKPRIMLRPSTQTQSSSSLTDSVTTAPQQGREVSTQ